MAQTELLKLSKDSIYPESNSKSSNQYDHTGYHTHNGNLQVPPPQVAGGKYSSYVHFHTRKCSYSVIIIINYFLKQATKSP